MLKHDRPRTKKNLLLHILGATHSYIGDLQENVFRSLYALFFFFLHTAHSNTLSNKNPHTQAHFFQFQEKQLFSLFKISFFILFVSFFAPSFPLRLFITADSRWRGEKIWGQNKGMSKFKLSCPHIGEHNLLEKEAVSASSLTEGRRQIKLEFTKNAFLTRTFITHSLLLFFSKIFLFFPLSLKRLWGDGGGLLSLSLSFSLLNHDSYKKLEITKKL